MNFLFQNKRIAGTLAVVPANERTYLEEMRNFKAPEARSLKLKEVMGFDRRRIVDGDVCVSDLAASGFKHIFDQGWLQPDEIDALILCTQTPDYISPPTSSIIQGRLGLRQDMVCLDINQACAGFVVGLIQAFMHLEQPSIRKVALVNADVLSRKASPQDRNIWPIIGDACAITLLERSDSDRPIHASVKNDGARAHVLQIPAGGLRLPSSPATAVLEDVGDNNLRAKDHFYMDGSVVFNFVQTEVPPLILSLLETAQVSIDQVDYFLTHQPNRFMLQKLADKLGVPHARMPNNVVERFGNSSGATIPINLALNLADRARGPEGFLACIAGFGGGLTWAAMLLHLSRLRFCSIIDYPSP
ncbi:MAG: ketoacyl-ACP synthase III [Opitutaceae bacterium]|nr:ketoacyl-ACP synthase III [Opitutaceae bacterium]